MKMNKRFLFCLLLAGISTVFSAPALSARSYLIELAVFTQHDGTRDEKWTANHPPLSIRKMARAQLPSQIMQDFAQAPVEMKESSFAFYVGRLKKDPGKTLILSTRWVQAVRAPASTTIARITNRSQTSVVINSAGMEIGQNRPTEITQPVLDGFISFYLSGQYTLEADIRYTPVYRSSILDEEPSTPTTYRIYEKRRMKSGELNYYDHPKIGMLLLVTPVEMPDPDSELKTKND